MTLKTVEPGFGQILAALATMQSNAQRKEKTQAHEFLEQFQKSVSAFATDRGCILMRHSNKHGMSQTQCCTTLPPLPKRNCLPRRLSKEK